MNDEHEIDIREPHFFERPLRACPTCGSENLRPVKDAGAIHFLCEDCTRCWHVELGYVHRVNPHTCSQCEFHEDCLRVFDADHS